MEYTNLGFFNRLIASVQLNQFYVSIRQEKTGKAIKFFMLFILILSSLTWAKISLDMMSGFSGVLDEVSDFLPEFTFEQGQFNFEIDEPMVYEENETIFIIDNNDTYSEEDLLDYSEGVYITPDYLIYRKSSYETRRVDFKEFGDITFDKAQSQLFVEKWSKIVFAVIIVFGFILSLIARMIGLLFVSLLGLILNAILKAELKYSEIFKTSVYVMVLPLCIKTLLALFEINVPFFFVLYYGLILFFFYKTLRLKLQPDLETSLDAEIEVIQPVVEHDDDQTNQH